MPYVATSKDAPLRLHKRCFRRRDERRSYYTPAECAVNAAARQPSQRYIGMAKGLEHSAAWKVNVKLPEAPSDATYA